MEHNEKMMPSHDPKSYNGLEASLPSSPRSTIFALSTVFSSGSSSRPLLHFKQQYHQLQTKQKNKMHHRVKCNHVHFKRDRVRRSNPKRVGLAQSIIGISSQLSFGRIFAMLPLLILMTGNVFPMNKMTAFAAEPPPEKQPKPNHCLIRTPHTINRPPIVIGHRGAAYNLPEHTIPSYRLALELGADYIEPDLVPTSDGHLVSYHGLDLSISTNVATIFPGRKRVMEANGEEGYYVQDFTLEEIRLIKVRQRVENRTTHFDDLFGIPTLSDIIDLLHDWNVNVRPKIGVNVNTSKTNSRPGLYAELKYAELLNKDANISMGDLFMGELKNNPKATELFFDDKNKCENLKFDEYMVPPLVVQSFEIGVLKYVRGKMEELITPTTKPEGGGDTAIDPIWSNGMLPPFILLISNKKCFGLYNNQEEYEEFWFQTTDARIDGIGPDKSCLITDRTSLGRDFMNIAKYEHHLVVHPWTERLELSFVTPNHGFETAEEELMFLFCVLKVDGIFAENVDLAVRVGLRGCDDYVYDGKSYGDKNKKGNQNLPPGTKVCYNTEKEEVIIVGAAFGVFGLFLGTFLTCWVSVNKRRRSVRRQLRNSSAVVPPSAEEEDGGSQVQDRRNEVDGDLEML